MGSGGDRYNREASKVQEWFRIHPNRYELLHEMGEGYPIRDRKATAVARLLLENCFTRLGIPKEIISDQEPEFEGALFTELCRSFNIDKLRTSSYRPSTKRMVEMYDRTLNQMLGKVVSDTQRDWDLHVPAAAAAYRASKHVVTWFTPNFMMLGREARAPVDIVLWAPASEGALWASAHECVADAQQRYRKAYAIARESLCVQAKRRKVIYDRKVLKRKFHIEQWVWYFYPRKYKGCSPKWSKMYVGPLLIVGIVSATNVSVQKTRNSPREVVQVDKLKVCRGETPKSSLPANEDDEDTVTVSGEETMVEAIPDDHTVEDQPNEMDEQPTDLTPADTNVNNDRQR